MQSKPIAGNLGQGASGVPLGVIKGDPLSQIETAIWVYNFEAGRIIWANAAALYLWEADSPAALAARDLRKEMSTSVATRLAQHREDFQLDPQRQIREFWTLYPNGQPLRVRAILRFCEAVTGEACMLVEAQPEDLREPETIRSADALLHAQIMIALFDRDGRELYANPAFRSAIGPGDHVFGQNFIAPAERARFVEGLAEDGEHRRTVQAQTTEGARWLDIHAVRCKDAYSGDGAFMISAADVTDAREQQMELLEARDAAESVSRMKSQFLATMSHEMRTPLNGVLGMASVLANSNLSDHQRRMLNVITASGERMLDLVDNTLDLVDLDSRAIKFSEESFDPILLVDAAIGSVAEAAEAQGSKITATFGDFGGKQVVHDPTRIRQVLRHLLLNAIKFSEGGGVQVHTTCNDLDGLRIEVADQGIGIAAAEHAKIFERFYQIDGSMAREHDGAGIGLSICKGLVERWHGRIGVNSEPGRGSVFWFTVPNAVREKPPAPPQPLRAAPIQLRVVRQAAEAQQYRPNSAR